MNSSRFRAAALLLAFLAAPLGAQTLFHIHLNAPTVKPIAGLDQRIQSGKLNLTLEDFLQLVLANNTQIHLLQLSNDSARYQVLAAHSPFDPSVTASFNSTRSVQPQTSQTSGARTLSSLNQRTSIGYNEVLPTGQTFTANFGSTRGSSNSAFNTFNPSIGTSLSLSFTQDLLRNRSNLQNKTQLLNAKTNVLVVSDQTQSSIATQLVSAATQYWQTVEARDQINVQQEALGLAQKSHDRDMEMLKLGALAEGQTYTTEAQVAQDQTSLLQAQSNYQQALDQVRRLIGADLDPAAKAATIVLTDDPSAVVPTLPTMSVDQAMQTALQHRPELDAIQRQELESKFSIAQARDSLRPQLNLTGNYGSNGLAGDQQSFTTPLGAVVGGTSTGFGTAVNQLFAFNSPTYGFSLQLTLPVRDSAAESQLANGLVQQTTAAYNLRNEEQQVRQDVRLADTQVRMAVAEVKSATTARDLAKKNVDYEQQEYVLGTITEFELLQGQVQLSNANATLVNAYTTYQIAKIAYERAVWTLLSSLHLKLQP